MRHRNVIPFRRRTRFGVSRLWLPPVLRRTLWRLTGIAGLVLLVMQVLPDAAVAVVQRAPAGACRVVSVVDGDTVRTWCPGRGLESARLRGFDTPEVFSPQCTSEWVRGTQATVHLRFLLLRAGTVTIVKEGTDRYGRALVKLWVDGTSVATHMIEAGLARPYSGGRRAGWCG
ncbi:thermonuclease family protein [Pseudooceanicola nanhaiensis]|uniref:thermonuclease family protein n=1 Tax=Pseudooceanicola nanhaiensis TaxID=375761 RepID=UPI001CD31E6C|nr:thermonuclease family protein [Pseudooceanicola nanhaiensis]MCA0921064.1 thermonuclease family protein [Pseudooceanicola nanhaiensis]